MNWLFYYFLLFIVIGITSAASKSLQESPVDSVPSGDLSNRSPVLLSQNEQEEISKSNLYLQFNTSELFPLLRDWKNQLHLSDGSHPSTNCMIFGFEGGCVLNKYLQAGLGYEFFFTTKVATMEASGDQINSTFFYGTFRAGTPLESIPELYLFSSIDIGSLSSTEVMENYYGLNYNKIGTTTAYRFNIGAQYFLLDTWSVMAGTGYLFGKVNNVTVNGQSWPPQPNFALDFTGILFRFAVNYHIPL
jgi:hypothetical protein